MELFDFHPPHLSKHLSIRIIDLSYMHMRNVVRFRWMNIAAIAAEAAAAADAILLAILLSFFPLWLLLLLLPLLPNFRYKLVRFHMSVQLFHF